MTVIHTTLNNCFDFGKIAELFPDSDEYEFTGKKVFRKKELVACPACGTKCVHNGFDFVEKKNIGRVKVGKQICPNCKHQDHADKSFWSGLLSEWYELISRMFLVLRDADVAWAKIAALMGFIVPLGKDKAMSLFSSMVEGFEYRKAGAVQIIHYDEQHPKEGRNQKYRLTILNALNRQVIADELFEDKNSQTIREFLLKHLDPGKELTIITDCANGYPELLKDIWGAKLKHQKCLLHLNKLISTDFGKFTNLHQEYQKYLLLDIFYDRTRELEKLQSIIQEQSEKTFETKKEKQKWIWKAKKKFYEYLRNLEKERRRAKLNLTQRTLDNAEEKFEALWKRKHTFNKKTEKRLEMIKKNWENFTLFYHTGCPATNNAIENFYSTSLKTHRKKQFRTDKGIIDHMKLSALKRVKDITKPPTTITELLKKFSLLIS